MTEIKRGKKICSVIAVIPSVTQTVIIWHRFIFLNIFFLFGIFFSNNTSGKTLTNPYDFFFFPKNASGKYCNHKASFFESCDPRPALTLLRQNPILTYRYLHDPLVKDNADFIEWEAWG